MRPAHTTEATEGFQEAALLAFLDQFEPDKFCRAVHIALSRLPSVPDGSSPSQHASEGFRRLSLEGDGRLFGLANGDLVFFYDASVGSRVKAELNRLATILTAESRSDGGRDSVPALVRIYDLSRELDEFVVIVRCDTCAGCTTERGEQDDGNSIKLRLQQRRAHKRSVPASVLPKLDECLRRMDLSNFVRLSSVSRFLQKSPPECIFTDVSISLSALSETVVSSFCLEADRPIARYVKKVLDRRILTMLLRGELKGRRKHIAVPLSLTALQSNAFKYFDNEISISLRGSILLKFSLLDVFSNLDAARFLFKMAQHRGYRILIDDVMPPFLSIASFAGLGVDYVCCDCDSFNMPASETAKQLSDACQRIAPAKIIVTGVDSREMLVHGVDRGIELFKGRYPEQMLRHGIRT